jgi:hypothetical protein
MNLIKDSIQFLVNYIEHKETWTGNCNCLNSTCRNHWNAWQQYIFSFEFSIYNCSFDDIVHLILLSWKWWTLEHFTRWCSKYCSTTANTHVICNNTDNMFPIQSKRSLGIIQRLHVWRHLPSVACNESKSRHSIHT